MKKKSGPQLQCLNSQAGRVLAAIIFLARRRKGQVPEAKELRSFLGGKVQAGRWLKYFSGYFWRDGKVLRVNDLEVATTSDEAFCLLALYGAGFIAPNLAFIPRAIRVKPWSRTPAQNVLAGCFAKGYVEKAGDHFGCTDKVLQHLTLLKTLMQSD